MAPNNNTYFIPTKKNSYPPRAYDGGMSRTSQQQFPSHRGAPAAHPSSGGNFHNMPAMHHTMRPRLVPIQPGSVASVFQGVAAKIGTGVIEDTLSAFNRIMAEKERRKTDRRDRRPVSPPRRMHGGPGDRRSRSYTRSRTRSPRRSSPMMRKRSRSPNNRRRSSRSPGASSSNRRHTSRSPQSSSSMMHHQRKGSRSPAPAMTSGSRRSRSRSPNSFNMSQ